MMAVAISLIVTILENLNGFLRTDENLIKMAKTFNANKLQILTKIVIPAKKPTFIKSLKVKNVCFSMYMCILGLMIINLFGYIGSNKGHIFLAVFVVMCAVCISRIINILLKKYKKASKVLAVLICVVAIFISTNIIVSGRDMINYVRNESQTPIMSISDFIDMKTKTEYLYFDSSKSFLASSYIVFLWFLIICIVSWLLFF